MQNGGGYSRARVARAEGTEATEARRRWGAVDERRLVLVLLAVAAIAAAVLLISWDSRLTFIADDWMLLVKRQGWGAAYFLKPFHGNIVAGPGLLYKLMREVFGLGSATPYYWVSIGTFVASGVLLFAYVRRRVGDWLALAAAVLLLFLGAAFEDLLWVFQIGYFGSVAAGLGMLLALEREDDTGDRVACGLLAVSLAFSSVGLVFAIGVLVDLATGRRPRRRRAYVALLPVGLFALWWLGWGHTAESHVTMDNLLGTPKFVFESAAAGFTSLLGLATGDGSEPSQPHLIWGEVVLVGVTLALAAKVARERKLSRWLLVVLAIGLAFWIVAGLNRNVSRLPTSSRYQYPSAVFLLLILAELLRGVRLPRVAVVPLAALCGLAIWGGTDLMHREYTERWVPYADGVRSSLAAVEIAGPSADPHYQVLFPPELQASARAYLAVSERYGSPAFSEAELSGRTQGERERADLILAQSLGLALHPPPGGQAGEQCEALEATSAGYSGLTLYPGEFIIRNESLTEVEVMLSRFAEGFPVSLGPLPPGEPAALSIPADRSPRPWNLGLVGSGPVLLCIPSAG
jgi:hypothetical protein